MTEGKLPNGWEQIVKRIAQKVAQQRFPRTQLAADLCVDAVSHVWEKREYFDPDSGQFEPWCYRVITNLAMDMLRHFLRRLEIDGPTGTFKSEPSDLTLVTVDGKWQTEQRRVDDELDSAVPFKCDELAHLEKLPPLRRVIALVLTGWWRAVPPSTWEQWLHSAGIDSPFPPPECRPIYDFSENVSLIAQRLGRTVDSVRQHFYRSVPVLRGLTRYDPYQS